MSRKEEFERWCGQKRRAWERIRVEKKSLKDDTTRKEEFGEGWVEFDGDASGKKSRRRGDLSAPGDFDVEKKWKLYVLNKERKSLKPSVLYVDVTEGLYREGG